MQGFVPSAVFCTKCRVLYQVQGFVPSAGFCTKCRVLYQVQGSVPSAGFCAKCRVLYLVQGSVPSAGFCTKCRVLTLFVPSAGFWPCLISGTKGFGRVKAYTAQMQNTALDGHSACSHKTHTHTNGIVEKSEE